MALSLGLFILSTIALHSIFLQDSAACAPYFDTERWRLKAEKFSVVAASEQCKFEHSIRGNSAVVTGDEYCKDDRLFVGRWHCVRECHSQCRQNTNRLESANCLGLKTALGRDGMDPLDLFVNCECHYANQSSCTTSEARWANIEETFLEKCAAIAESTCVEGNPCLTDEDCGMNGKCGENGQNEQKLKSCCPVEKTTAGACPAFMEDCTDGALSVCFDPIECLSNCKCPPSTSSSSSS